MNEIIPRGSLAFPFDLPMQTENLDLSDLSFEKKNALIFFILDKLGLKEKYQYGI